MRWLEAHGNHYLYDTNGDPLGTISNPREAAGVVSDHGIERGLVWKVFRGGSAPTVAEAREAAENASWSFLGFFRRRYEWSQKVFGPAKRTKGIVEHMRKELNEVEKDPMDLSEWVDLIFLASDGFFRHGGTPETLRLALEAKHAKNEARVWPDWRGKSENVAIEHDRSGE